MRRCAGEDADHALVRETACKAQLEPGDVIILLHEVLNVCFVFLQNCVAKICFRR